VAPRGGRGPFLVPVLEDAPHQAGPGPVRGPSLSRGGVWVCSSAFYSKSSRAAPPVAWPWSPSPNAPPSCRELGRRPGEILAGSPPGELKRRQHRMPPRSPVFFFRKFPPLFTGPRNDSDFLFFFAPFSFLQKGIFLHHGFAGNLSVLKPSTLPPPVGCSTTPPLPGRGRGCCRGRLPPTCWSATDWVPGSSRRADFRHGRSSAHRAVGFVGESGLAILDPSGLHAPATPPCSPPPLA